MYEPTVDGEALLTPAEVAAMFRVNPKTVTRWARAGTVIVGHQARRPGSCLELTFT